MADGFDLSAMLGNVSKLNIMPGQEQIEYIPFEKILPDTNNGYSMDGVEDLARNIELVGLQQPLRLYPAENDCYMINSGHRRRAAVELLIKDGSTMFDNGVPSIIDRAEDSPAVREFKLIAANMDNRKLTDADLSQQWERLQDVLRRLEDEGFKITGRARDWVAELSGVSRSKIARLQAIRNNLAPSILSEFDAAKVNTAVAYELQKLPQDFQLRLFKVVPVLNMHDVERAREWYEQGQRWEPDLKCPDGKPCKRGDTFLRHDIDHPSWPCFGKRCCMKCSRGLDEYSPCDRKCSKCEAARKEKRDKRKEAEEQRAAREQEKLKKQIAVSAKRIVKAADAAKLPDNLSIRTSRYYNNSYPLGQIRKMAQGVFPPGFHAYSDPFTPQAMAENIQKLCVELQCSADYLLGRTDELSPAPIAPEETPKVEAIPEPPPATVLAPWSNLDSSPLPDDGDVVIALYRPMKDAKLEAKIAEYQEGIFRSRDYHVLVPHVLWWAPYHDPEE